jgi:GNAT superfamily N-acetyltransferase
MIRYAVGEPPTVAEYVEFLRHSDLGAMYPKRDFETRIGRVLSNVKISVTARDDGGRLVGVCFGITDFAYFLFLTDLGVARDHLRKGIGARMVAMAHEAAGGERDIHMITWANGKAMPFYESCGMRAAAGLVAKHALDRDVGSEA